VVYRDSYQSISTLISPTGVLQQAKPGLFTVVGGLLYCLGNFLVTETTLLRNQVHNHNYTVSKELANSLPCYKAIVVNNKVFFNSRVL